MNTPDRFLHRVHQRARFNALVWSLTLAALATFLHLATSLNWLPPSAPLVIGHWSLVISSAIVLTIWIRRSRRLSAHSLARRLDAEWSLAARLESSAELASDRSALASAQRADAARHLDAHPAPGAAGWFSGVTLLALVGLLLLTQVSLLGLRALGPDPEVAQPAALPPDISATIVWETPESEIKATAIEEILLVALATSRTGLRSLSLEIAVNGEPRLSRPLDTAMLATLAKPGAHPVDVALYLDEVAAEEFDLVSYHLRAERLTATPTPPVASPLQFIQIRPPREDVIHLKTPPGGGGSDLNLLATLLGNLKAAQLQLLKQNFLLAHATIDHASTAWREENTRITADQKLLAQKTTEAREFAITEALPTLVVDNLTQCIPLMESAAVQIAAAANEPAAKPQGQALGLIVASEKLIRKIMIESQGQAGPPGPKNHDPFKNEQTFKLPPRANTPAGQLEQLAQAQANAAAGQAASNKKDPLAEQADLAAKLAALAAAKSLDPAAQAKTAQAALDAAEAARQLAQGDTAAARAPGAAAAQALREATAAQEAAGRATAQAVLENIRRELNAAESLADPAARAEALAAATAQLRAEAIAQQQTGSAEAARQLAATAAKTAQGANSADDAAAAAQAVLTPRDHALARAARQLSRASQPGPGSVGSAPEVELGAQLAAQLLADPAARELSGNLIAGLRARSGSANTVVPPDLRGAADKLVALLEAARQSGRRDEQVRRFNPDDLDAVYRPAVEAYFEKLSRDAK